MEYLKKVLIKEVDGGKMGDKVFYVENLPKSFLYRKEKKQIIDYTDPHNRQRYVPDFVVDDSGRKKNTNATEDVLLPGIEMSQTGDEAFCFFTQLNEARDRLAAIDRYIQQTVPVYDRVAQRTYYAMQPGVLSSGPIALSAIPSVVLPEPASPPANAEQIQANGEAFVKKPKRAMSEAHKAKIKASLELAKQRRAAQKAS